MRVSLAYLLQGDELSIETIWTSILLQGTAEETEIWLANLIDILTLEANRQQQSKHFDAAESLYRQASPTFLHRTAQLWLNRREQSDSGKHDISNVGIFKQSREKCPPDCYLERVFEIHRPFLWLNEQNVVLK